jgi:hypothetical protein
LGVLIGERRGWMGGIFMGDGKGNEKGEEGGRIYF